MRVSVMAPNPAASIAASMGASMGASMRQSVGATFTNTELDRSCTDILCLVIYALLLATSIGICVSTQNEAIPMYDRPRDIEHNPCVLPFRYLYTPTTDSYNSVCVTFCPMDPGILLECQPNSLYSTCPVSIEGLIRDEQFHLCYILGAEISKPKLVRSIWTLVIQYRMAIIKSALYAAAFSLALAILTLVAPDIMAYATIMLLEILLLGLSLICFYRYFSGAQSFINTYMPFYFTSTKILLLVGGLFAVAAIISLLTICYRLAQIRFVVIMLKIARECVVQNMFMPLVSVLLAGVCVGVFYLNTKILNQSLALVDLVPGNHQAHDQIMSRASGTILGVIWVIQFLWTHGVLISMIHFVFESWTTFWYYNSLVAGLGGFSNFTSTLRLVVIHFGTIVFGACYPYYSQSLANIANNLEYNFAKIPFIYNTFCCLHNCCCRYLSVYSFIQTSLKSYAFWPSNLQMYNIRVLMSRDLRRVYMLGTYYANSGKYLVISAGMVFCYFSLRWQPDIFTNLWNLILPIIVASMLAAQVGTCFLDTTGLVADTVLLNYYMEFEFLRVNMMNMPMNTPPVTMMWIQQAVNMP